MKYVIICNDNHTNEHLYFPVAVTDTCDKAQELLNFHKDELISILKYFGFPYNEETDVFEWHEVKDFTKPYESINPIPCNIHTAEVSYDYRGIKIEKIAISTHSKVKDIKKAIEDEDYGDDNTVVLFKKQYDRIFAPLFAEIAKLNAQIRELKGGE